jgi:putative FmdB family regulatory protein
MPNYDFRCLNCGKRFEVFLSFTEYGKAEIKCSFCGSAKVQRKIGRIMVARSNESRADEFSNPSMLDNMGQDTESMGRMMRKMSSETGEPMPPEFDEVVGRLERGESPEEIEKQMPDLGSEGGFPDGDFD